MADSLDFTFRPDSHMMQPTSNFNLCSPVLCHSVLIWCSPKGKEFVLIYLNLSLINIDLFKFIVNKYE